MAGTHRGTVEPSLPRGHGWCPSRHLVAGTLFASSVRASQGEDLRTDQAQLPDLIRAQNRTNETRAADLDDLQGQVDEATARAGPRRPADPDSSERRGRRRSRRPPVAPGARAPRCRVTLDDAKLAGGEVPAARAEPRRLVVHQQDVQVVVNALWEGGAEAMMLRTSG